MELKRIDKIVIGAIALVIILWAISRCGRGGTDPADPAAAETAAPAANSPNAAGISKPVDVYISADSLKMRTGPNTDSAVVVLLRRNDVVTLTGEKSAFTQTIKLDNVAYTEPWLKVRSKNGKTGWVFGGGIRPYKK